MQSYSLRRRILILAASWAAIATTILGGVLVLLLISNIDRATETRLQAGVDRLAAALDNSGGLPAAAPLLPDAAYSIPAGGAYWQVTDLDSGETERSRSLWDFTLPDAPAGDTSEPAALGGPDGQALLSLTRTIRLATGTGERALRVTVAEARRTPAEVIEGFGRDMTLALGVLFVAIIIAAGIQAHLVLTPLVRLRQGIEEIRRNNSTGIHGVYPEELRPLINELNDLLVIRENSLQFARARAADLAHGIKTPLSVFLSIADRLDAKGDTANAELVRELSGEISDRIGYQLQLARLRVRSRSEVMATSLNEALNRIVTVLQRTQRGEGIGWELALGDEVTVDIERHDLIELLGTLLENACNWAETQVAVTVTEAHGMALVSIDDDGPGVSDDELATLGARGRRLDEQRSGSGMGLSIAKEIASLNKGRLTYERSRRGGLGVRLSLPVTECDGAGPVPRPGVPGP